VPGDFWQVLVGKVPLDQMTAENRLFLKPSYKPAEIIDPVEGTRRLAGLQPDEERDGGALIAGYFGEKAGTETGSSRDCTPVGYANGMPTFRLPRDRDAWGVIRGYVYQVDMTIYRWLALDMNQVLALEFGEDIDLISKSLIAADDDERERLLEQVKYREASLTLKSPAAIGALACAVEHRCANPDFHLFFRYTTNAIIVRERSSPMPERMPALVAWERLRRGELTPSVQNDVLSGLRRLFANARRPSDLPRETWSQFRGFLKSATDAELLELVRCFEWGSGGPKSELLAVRIQEALRSRGFAQDEKEAEQQYHRLFLFVFKLLCMPGAKRLSVPDRSIQLALPTLSASDRALLNDMLPQIRRLEARVATLEQTYRDEVVRKDERDVRIDRQLSTIVTALESPRAAPSTAFDAELDEAKGHIDRFEFPEARLLVQRVRNRHWGELSAWQKYRVIALLGNASLGEGKFEDAGRLFLEAVHHQPDDEKARTNEAAGFELLRENEQAFKLATALRKDFPHSARALSIWLRTASDDMSPEDLEAAIPALHEKEGEVLVAVASRALNGNYGQAERLLRIATLRSPDWPPTWALLGKAILGVELSKVRYVFAALPKIGDCHRLREAVECLTKAIDLGRRQHTPLAAESLTDRAVAREALGELDAASTDYHDACAMSPDDPHVHLRFGKHLGFRRKLDDAVLHLRRAVKLGELIEAPFYLAIALRQRGSVEDRREAQSYFRGIAADPRSVRVDAALEFAIEDDIEAQRWAEAEQMLANPGAMASSAATRSSLAALLLLAKGNREAAIREAESALASVTSETPTSILRRLAQLLTQMDRDSDALSLLRRIAVPGDDGPDNRQLIAVATRLGRIDVVLNVCTSLREIGTDDAWVFHNELSVLERHNPPRAVELLQQFLASRPDAPTERLRLSVLGIRLGRKELVTTAPDNVPDWKTVLPINGRAVVLVLHHIGYAREAREYAYQLLRRCFQDPTAHQAFVMSMLARTSPTEQIPEMGFVTIGSAVRYAEKGEEEDRWFIIEDAPSPNSLLNEYPPDHFCSKQLMGKKVGDEFILTSGERSPRAGIVREAIHKFVYRLNDCMQQWQVRFPNDPSLELMRTAHRLQGGQEPDLRPIFERLDRDWDHKHTFLDLYRTQPLSLHRLGELLGRNVLETMHSLANLDRLRIRCCGGTEQDRNTALAVIRDSDFIVVDLSALATMAILGQVDLLRSSPKKLIVAHAAMEELRSWLAEASVDRDRQFLGKAEHGYFFHRISEEEQSRWRALLQALVDAVVASCEIRPVEAIVSLVPEVRERWMESFGQASLESVFLASQDRTALWTDDGIVAALGKLDFGVGRIWTQMWLQSRFDNGTLNDEIYAEACAKLVGHGFEFTSFNDKIALNASKLAAWDPDRWPLKRMLDLFGTEEMDLDSSIGVAGHTLVLLFQEPVLAGAKERVVQRLLDCLAKRRRGLHLIEHILKNLRAFFGLDAVHEQEARTMILAWRAARPRIYRF
jgi:tetratricopeptide (TPR) repeat protein